MINTNRMSKFVLEQLKDGKIEKSCAIELVKQLNVKEDVAIIGMALKNQEIEDYNDYWKCFVDKKTNVRRSSKKRMSMLSSAYGNPIGKLKKNKGSYIEDIDLFDREFFEYTEQEATYLNPGLRKVYEVVYRALEDAGYLGERLKDNKMGLFLGNNFIKDTVMSYPNMCLKNPGSYDAFEILLLNWTSGFATRVANYFDMKGPAYVMDGSCASSTIAIDNACMCLQTGMCTTAVAGGMLIDLMSPLKTDSKLNWALFHDDNVITKMFDNNPGGAFMAEGVAFLVLKPLEQAIEDGDRIHGVISGWSQTSNGRNGNYLMTSAEDIRDAALDSIRKAKVDVNDIGFLLEEGYPDKMVEGVELAGISDAFGKFTKKKQFCGLSTIVSNMGYMQSAIGTFNTIYATMALKNKTVPPTYHFVSPTDALNLCNTPFYVNDMARDWPCQEGHSRYAAVNSYGYGGINIFLVIREAPEQKYNAEEKKENLFVLTAKTEYSMRGNVEAFIQFLRQNPNVNLTQLCANLATRRTVLDEYRLAITCSSIDDLLRKLNDFTYQTNEEKKIYYGVRQMEEMSKRKRVHHDISEESSLNKVAREFSMGKDFWFASMYEGYDISYVKLPGYEFDRKSYWSEDYTKNRMQKLAGRLLPKREAKQ